MGQGNIFRSVCQEFCPQGGSASVYAGIPPPGSRHHPSPLAAGTPRSRQPPPRAGTPRTRHPPGPDPPSRVCWEIRSTNGRYASYWNAILLWTVIAGIVDFSLSIRVGWIIILGKSTATYSTRKLYLCRICFLNESSSLDRHCWSKKSTTAAFPSGEGSEKVGVNVIQRLCSV